MEQFITWVAGAVALMFGSLWFVFLVIEGFDLEAATQRFSNAVFSRLVGAVGAFAILAGEAANAAGELMAILFQVPSLIIAAIGFGGMSGHVDMSPGLFVVVAIATFLLAQAVSGR